jgi:DNA-binding transcriptional regulator LsrR (DeoR family)
MKTKHISDDFLTMAAQLCYVDGIPQQQAAKMLNVSQAKVSRLLAMARERGIVQISVKKYNPRNKELEELLRTIYKFKEVIVIKTARSATTEDARQTLGHFGSEALAECLRPDLRLGLAGGRTIMETVDGLLKSRSVPRLTAVQLMGNVGSRPEPTDASEIGRRLVSSEGSFFALNTPVFVPSKEIRNSFLELDQIKSVTDSFKNLDMALVGLGIPENSIFNSQNVIDKTMADELRSMGVTGEICGRFFDSNGMECITPYKDRVISIDFSDLRQIPAVFGVVCGTDRTEAVKSAVKGDLINSLLIDEAGAALLLSAPSEVSA